MNRFPALRLAREAAEKRGSVPAVMNAANEVAVDAFLEGQITFDQIVHVVEKAMNKMDFHQEVSLESILDIDRRTRIYCVQSLQ